ncbi:MAG TPA: TlpA disulfide reductase family protein [Pyrinomonadaceae bacterium]|nr:TlpA disulfide reductase family protein [Pyrinomonadaceae bacterium]
MTMKKLALFLLLALSADTFATAAGAHTLTTRGTAAAGGIQRRAGAHGAKRKARTRRRRAGARIIKGTIIGRFVLPDNSPTVTEIDAEGLKKLLQRDEAATAQPLLINFWATWCVPCRKEFPDLVRIGADYRARGLRFALISADDVSEIKTTVPRFLREMRATAISAYLLNATDTEAAIAQVDPMWGGELPATFLFDRQGKIAYRHFGIIKDAELREAIEKVVTGDR